MKPVKALIVDDDPAHRIQMANFLADFEIECLVAGRFIEGLDLGLRLRPELLVVDWRLGGDLHGIALVRILKALLGPLRVIMVSGYLSGSILDEANEAGVDFVLDKPFEMEDLQVAVGEVMAKAPSMTGPPLGFCEIRGQDSLRYANGTAQALFGLWNAPDGSSRAAQFLEDVASLCFSAEKFHARIAPKSPQNGEWDVFVFGSVEHESKIVIIVDEEHRNSIEAAIMHYLVSPEDGSWRRSPCRSAIVVVQPVSRGEAERRLVAAGYNTIRVQSADEAERIMGLFRNVKFVLMEQPFSADIELLLPLGQNDQSNEKADLPRLCSLVPECTRRKRFHGNWQVGDLLEFTFSVEQDLHRDRAVQIVGSSPEMNRLRQEVGLAAQSPLNVLLSGESGVGKELIARAIHALSDQAKSPFCVVNCATMPESGDLPSVLLKNPPEGGAGSPGHAILFLDELGELSPRNQARICRLVESGDGLAKEHAGIRVFGVTSSNLRQMMDEGHFRLDLYYRLASIEIRVPPLREHAEDIPEIARHILDLGGYPDTVVEDEALDMLCGLDWPGNVRELQNCLLRAAGSNADCRLGLAAFGFLTATASTRRMWKSLKDIERQHIERVLAACGGNVTQAAEILGISRTTLYSKIKDGSA